MKKTTQNLKLKFNKNVDKVMKTQADLSMVLKNKILVSQPESSKQSLISRMNQSANKISRFKGKIEILD